MEDRREMLSLENRLFMQNKAFWGNDSDRAYGRGGNVLPVLSRRGQDLFSPAEDVPVFLFGNRFFGKGPVFSVRPGFSAGSAEAEKEVRLFFFCRAESGWPSDFRFSGQESFWTEKHLLFLTGKE